MRWWIYLWVGLVCLPLFAEQEFETQMCPEGTPILPSPQGDPQATIELASQLYQLAGPRLGCRFFESTYLLCLGDLRPYAAYNGYLPDPTPEDSRTLDRLNEYLVPRGFSLHGRKADFQGRVQAFSLRSLRGLESYTHKTRLSWVPKYSLSSGWPGYYKWKNEIWKGMPDRANGFDRVEGVMLGYPPVAIENFQNLNFLGFQAVRSYVRESDRYLCDEPAFWLRWQDAQHPEVVDREQQWGSFLEKAYATPKHQNIAKDPTFLAARTRVAEQNPDLRGSELERLGLRIEPAPSNRVDSQQEAWFRSRPSGLWQALEASSSLPEIALRSGGPRVTGEQIAEWLRRGTSQADPLAHELAQRYRQLHPVAWDNFIRSKKPDLHTIW